MVFLILSLLSASFFEEKNKPFLLDNVSNLTQFQLETLTKKNILVKIVIQKLMCEI